MYRVINLDAQQECKAKDQADKSFLHQSLQSLLD